MATHYSVQFDSVNPHDFYPEGSSRDELDALFEERLSEELDEEYEVVTVYSESAADPYAVFRVRFEKSNFELYEKYGKEGVSPIVKEVAEEVYGHTAESVLAESW